MKKKQVKPAQPRDVDQSAATDRPADKATADPMSSGPGSVPPALPPPSGPPAGDPNWVDVTGKMPEDIRIDPDITEGHPGYEESGDSEIILPERLAGGEGARKKDKPG